MIGRSDGSTGFTNGANNDQVGTNAAPLDPKLDPTGLQYRGGPTQTIALLPDSPAIDKGTADGLTGTLATDQRGAGFVRTHEDPAVANAAGGDGTDVGAFELEPSGPAPTPSPTPTPTPSPSPTPTPTPTPIPAQLVVTTTPLVRSRSGDIVVGVTVENAGGVTANDVKLAAATLSSPTTSGKPLPQNLKNIAPGRRVTVSVTFSGANNPAGAKQTLSISGTFNGGAFAGKWKVTLP